MSNPALSLIILAAGKGTRMKSDMAKVLHEVFFAPMVHHVIKATLPLQPGQTIAVIGHQKTAVEKALQSFDVGFVVQQEQLGTGHAVLVAEKAIGDACRTIMILCGDTPLIRTETLQEMYASHERRKSAITLMTTVLDNPTNYGRIISDCDNRVQTIIEQKDATKSQLEIREINAGIYCVDKDFLFSALKMVGTDNSQHEVYLTDIVKLAVQKDLNVDKFMVHTPLDVLGVNSRVELADAQTELQMRRNRALMLEGVSMYSPETISVSPESSVNKDTVLNPCVNISGSSRIGCNCRIGQGAVLENCQIGDNATIGPYGYLVDCTVASDTVLAPFSRNSQKS